MKLTPEEKAAKMETRRLAAEAEARFLAFAPQFKEWPKIGRLNRDIVITEKLDGTNAAVVIVPDDEEVAGPGGGTETVVTGRFKVYAQSRTRILTPQSDNFGFRAWVEQNADALIYALGPGTHFGEWWGKGIQRGYGLTEKRFSLFNTDKWFDKTKGLYEAYTPELVAIREAGVAIGVVPILYSGPWMQVLGYKDDPTSFKVRYAPDFMIEWLRKDGSVAVPGFAAEGVVVFHKASGTLFKATVDADGKHKGEV